MLHSRFTSLGISTREVTGTCSCTGIGSVTGLAWHRPTFLWRGMGTMTLTSGCSVFSTLASANTACPARAASARSTLRRASLRADQRASRRRCVEIGASGTRWTAGSGSLAAIRPSTAAFPTTPARQHRTLRSNAPSCESTRSRGSTATSTLFWPVCHVFSSYTTPHAASQKKTKKMWCRVYST